MTPETLQEEIDAIKNGACAACASSPAIQEGFCACCFQMYQEIQASPTGTITFRRSLEICDEHGQLTDSQRSEWLTHKEGAG